MQDFQQQENTEKFTLGKAIFKTILMTFLVFCVPAMLWFIPAFNSHVKYSKLSGANSNAAAISKTANSALTDMDENEYFIGGTHVLCSEKSHNITDGTLNEDIFMNIWINIFRIIFISGGLLLLKKEKLHTVWHSTQVQS